MAKKAKYITNRDKKLFKQLGRTGIITQEQLQGHLGYADNNKRINTLVRSGYLKKGVGKIGKEYVTVYKLDKTGIDYTKNTLGLSYLYKSASCLHDKELTDLYYTKLYEYRETWQTETYYKFYKGQINGIPDATIQIGEQTIAIEVTTSTYTQEQIQEKIENAESNGWKIEFYQAQ